MQATTINWLDQKLKWKKWIDESSFEVLLMRWRHSPNEDEMLEDESTYDYFHHIIDEKGNELTDEEYKMAYRNTNIPQESDFILWEQQ